ncbi:hypothetical protein EDB81DRAFT_851830 [Dactylonectria macrodidyma]|uniref:Mg2+ transporter n=1 Tax=Dactylonectria macrodidyma TaxID=307937 RepID=A0A9P9FQY6_9HYPO|nr:hypothetical protein EDB81DRAFT_851830 [Dactylonectria macrodidyma]
MSRRPEGDARPSHVRFADGEEYVSRRRTPGQDSGGRSRRGTRGSAGDNIYERQSHRRDTGDGPSSRSSVRIESPVTSAGRQQHAEEGSTEGDDEDLEPATAQDSDEEVRLTESPPPINSIDGNWEEPVHRPQARPPYMPYMESGRPFTERGRITTYSQRRPSLDGPQRRLSLEGPQKRSSLEGPYSAYDPWDGEHFPRPGRSQPRSRQRHYSEHDYYPPPRSERNYYRSHRRNSGSSDDSEPYDRFRLDLMSPPVPESSKDGDSETESPEPENRTIAKDERGKARTAQTTAVKTSLYTGNAELGGSHSATLTAVHGQTQRKESLFRWIHVRQDVMNFEELWSEISCVPDLSDLEKRAVTRLRASVKGSLKARHNAKGTKVGYVDPRSIEIPLKSLTRGNATRGAPAGSARWICIPYFSLDQYSGLLSASNISLFPAQTLLQAQYSRTNVQRDMEQAVCQLGNANRGECFHIAQLWCVVIDNSLLVTCGTMSQSDLQGDALKVNDEPSRDLTMSNQGQIRVYYGDSVTWSLEIDECQTWFAFISKFQAFWPNSLEFWHQGQVVKAAKWPKILRIASHTRLGVRITMKLDSLPAALTTAVLEPDNQSDRSPQAARKETETDDFAHLLMLPQANRKRTSTSTQSVAVKAQLDSVDKFLTQSTSYSNRSAYKSCKSATRKECHEYLAGIASDVEANGTEEVRRAYEEKIDIFNTSKTLYRFFLPQDFEGPTSGKFWGAIRIMLELKQLQLHYVVVDDMLEIGRFLRNLIPSLIAFQNIISHASAEERKAFEVPEEFVRAWLYVVMGMVYGAQDNRRWKSRMSRVKDLVDQGTKKMMHWLPDKSLLERTSMLPLEVLSLVTFGLLQDQAGKSDDICETYSQYLSSLENSIMSKQLDRSYQRRIDLVQQEISAVKRTLKKQRNIIGNIRKSLTAIHTPEVVKQNENEAALRKQMEQDREKERARERDAVTEAPLPYGLRAGVEDTVLIRPGDDYMGDEEFIEEISSASKLSSTDKGGLRGLIFMECSRLVEQREFEFWRYTEYASDLERAISFKMDFTKDRQENAIFAFTLVTIVFLPIGTVSSIFGMNTADVRDMESSQWLYWAVAIPLTLFVILAGLWWMGELAHLARWIRREPSHSSRGYQRIPGPIHDDTVQYVGPVPSTRVRRRATEYY